MEAEFVLVRAPCESRGATRVAVCEGDVVALEQRRQIFVVLRVGRHDAGSRFGIGRGHVDVSCRRESWTQLGAVFSPTGR